MACNKQPDGSQGPRVALRSLLHDIPIELLRMVIKDFQVAFVQDVQTLSDPKTQSAIEEAYRDLRSLCLVSKTLDAIIRPILLENVIVFRSTNLAALYRTLLENESLGDYVRHIVFYTYTRSYYFQGKTENYRRLPLGFLDGLDADFDPWQDMWRLEIYRHPPLGLQSELIFSIYLKVLSRTRNVETVAINTLREGGGTTPPKQGQPLPPSPKVPPLSRLKMVRLIGKTSNLQGGYRRDLGSLVLDGQPSLERLVWLNDYQAWFKSTPSNYRTHASSRTHHWECDALKVLELQETTCLLTDITDICESFPGLQTLSVYSDCTSTSERLSKVQRSATWPDTWSSPGCESLSASLARMQQLEVLRLDLHYDRDIDFIMGPDGILSLSALPRLRSLTVPFHYLVRKSAPSSSSKSMSRIVDPCLVLPQSLCSLRLLVDFDCLYKVFSRTSLPYEVQERLLQFLEALGAHLGGHFSKLGDVTYSYCYDANTVEDGAPCSCAEENTRCSYHLRVWLLSLSAPGIGISEDVLGRFRALVGDFAGRDVRLAEEDMTAEEGLVRCRVDLEDPVFILREDDTGTGSRTVPSWVTQGAL